MELQKGRPMDTTGRLAKETRTYDLLDSLGIEYNRIDHAPAMTMEVCQEIDKTLQAVIHQSRLVFGRACFLVYSNKERKKEMIKLTKPILMEIDEGYLLDKTR